MMKMQKAPVKPVIPHTAMHGPNGEYESADPQREAELRELGWIDGHEYWRRVVAGEPSAADLDAVEAEKQLAKPRKFKKNAQ